MTIRTRPRRYRCFPARIALIATLVIMLTGCIQLPFLSRESKSVPEPVDLNRLFETVASLRQADPDLLRASADAADPQDPSELLGWTLAMVALGEPADKARATQLLKTYLNQPGQTAGSLAMATLLLENLQSEARLRRRLAVAIRQRDDLNTRVLNPPKRGQDDLDKHTLRAIIRERDELTTQLNELTPQLDALKANQQQQQIRDLTLRTVIRERDELTTQLEELKAIELQIRDRKRDSDLELPTETLK